MNRMTRWLVQYTYHPSFAPDHRYWDHMFVRAPDPDGAIGTARAGLMERGHTRVRIRACVYFEEARQDVG